MLGCDAGWRNANSQGKRATRITRALSPDPFNAELPICTRLCMRSINFCEFSASSFSYFDCPFLSSPRSSPRSFLFCSYGSCFLLGKLGVGLSIICNGSGSRPQFCIACNSATCTASSTSDITLSCYSGSIGTRIVGSTSPSGDVPVKLCEQCSQPQLLNQAPHPCRATTADGQALHSLDCCILFTAITRSCIVR